MAPIPVTQVLDFGNLNRITNLAQAVANGQPVTLEQLHAAIQGLAWKDDVVVATQVNISLSNPGTTLDGISMTNGDRVLVKSQSTPSQNGIYLWNGGSTLMTRAADASTFAELHAAVVPVQRGTSAGSSFRQTQIGGTLDSSDIVWANFGAAPSQATESAAGIAEVATQGETDTGTDDQRFITPLKLANWAGRKLKLSSNIGDGTATSFTITHNFGTRDIHITVYEAAGSYREIIVDKQHTTTNTATIVFDSAPTLNAYRSVVLG